MSGSCEVETCAIVQALAPLSTAVAASRRKRKVDTDMFSSATPRREKRLDESYDDVEDSPTSAHASKLTISLVPPTHNDLNNNNHNEQKTESGKVTFMCVRVY